MSKVSRIVFSKLTITPEQVWKDPNRFKAKASKLDFGEPENWNAQNQLNLILGKPTPKQETMLKLLRKRNEPFTKLQLRRELTESVIDYKKKKDMFKSAVLGGSFSALIDLGIVSKFLNEDYFKYGSPHFHKRLYITDQERLVTYFPDVDRFRDRYSIFLVPVGMRGEFTGMRSEAKRKRLGQGTVIKAAKAILMEDLKADTEKEMWGKLTESDISGLSHGDFVSNGLKTSRYYLSKVKTRLRQLKDLNSPPRSESATAGI